MDCLILNHSDWLMFLRQGLTLCVNLDASYRPANDLAQLTMEIKTLEWSPEGEQRVLGPGRHNLTRVTFQSDGLYCAAHWRTDDGEKNTGWYQQWKEGRAQKNEVRKRGANEWRIWSIFIFCCKGDKAAADLLVPLQLASLLSTWGANST